MTYLSVVSNWLRIRAAGSEVLVEGVAGHPMARLSDIGAEVAERWRQLGY